MLRCWCWTICSNSHQQEGGEQGCVQPQHLSKYTYFKYFFLPSMDYGMFNGHWERIRKKITKLKSRFKDCLRIRIYGHGLEIKKSELNIEMREILVRQKKRSSKSSSTPLLVLDASNYHDILIVAKKIFNEHFYTVKQDTCLEHCV